MNYEKDYCNGTIILNHYSDIVEHLSEQNERVGITEEKERALINEKAGSIGFLNSFNKLKLVKKSTIHLRKRRGSRDKKYNHLAGGEKDESRFN